MAGYVYIHDRARPVAVCNILANGDRGCVQTVFGLWQGLMYSHSSHSCQHSLSHFSTLGVLAFTHNVLGYCTMQVVVLHEVLLQNLGENEKSSKLCTPLLQDTGPCARKRGHSRLTPFAGSSLPYGTIARLPSSSVAKMRVMRSNLTTFAPDPETLASSIYITITMFANSAHQPLSTRA